MWNLWHGCHKKSEGCQHCYVFRRDAEFEKDSNVVTKTSSFNLPIRRDCSGNWKVPSGTLIWTCFTSDFFIEEADQWREDAWLMIHRRNDLHFFMITKRPERILQCLPEDWSDKQTGAHFRKDGRIYNIPRNQQMKQAHRAAIDYNTKLIEPSDNA